MKAYRYEKISRRKRRFCLCLAAAMCFLSSCSLATAEGGQTAGEDELIGLYVTTKYVDLPMDDQPELKMTASGSYEIKGGGGGQGRLYGELDQEGREVRFPDLKGYALVNVTLKEENGDYITTIASDRFYDVATDWKGENLEIKAVIAFDRNAVAEEGKDAEFISGSPVFYANPVYMTQDGRIYLISGSGMVNQTSAPAEVSYSTVIKDTINGQSESKSSKITLSIEPKAPLSTAAFTQRSADGEVLRSDEYSFGQLPEQYIMEKETAYTVVEITDSAGEVQYDLLNRDDTGYQLYGSDGSPVICPYLLKVDVHSRGQ